MSEQPTQELITAEEFAHQPDEELGAEEARLAEYHELMMQMSPELTLRPGIPKIPGLSRKRVMQAFMDSFELIGGVPRMSLWANEHPGEFYRMFGKLLPSTALSMVTNNSQTIVHVLPPTKLDE